MATVSNTSKSKKTTTKGTKSTKAAKTEKVSRSDKIANKVKAARRLIETCEREIFKGEFGMYTIRGVENVTRSDVDTIIVYCEYFIKNKTIGGLMPPRGVVGDVLKKIDIVEKNEGWLFL